MGEDHWRTESKTISILPLHVIFCGCGDTRITQQWGLHTDYTTQHNCTVYTTVEKIIRARSNLFPWRNELVNAWFEVTIRTRHRFRCSTKKMQKIEFRVKEWARTPYVYLSLFTTIIDSSWFENIPENRAFNCFWIIQHGIFGRM